MYGFIKEGDASNFYLPASDIFLTTRIVWAFGNMNWKNLTKAHFSPTFAPQNAWIEEDLLTTLTTKSESIIQELNWEYSVVYTIRWYLRFLRRINFYSSYDYKYFKLLSNFATHGDITLFITKFVSQNMFL